MAFHQTAFHYIHKKLIKAPELSDRPQGSLFSQLTDEATLQYSKALHLCLITVGMLSLAFLINYFEGNRVLLITLSVIFVLSIVFFCVLLITRNGVFPLVGISLLLMALGVFLLLGRSTPDGSLFWFLLLPPILMFCVGLKLGTVLFCCFYMFLLLVMLTPMDTLLAYDFSQAFRWRFLGSILGIFIFSWLAEYTRTQTRNALVQAVKMLERSSLTDPLTSLGNRRDFQNYFMVNQAQLQRANRMFSIAMLDIDFFKAINDTFGHAIGDQVLCHISALLSSYLRVSDRIFRWGGEEFVILMPDTTYAEAHVIMERLRHEVEESSYTTRSGHSINMTISIGLHSGTLDCTIEKHVAAADEKLYLAKRSGRNQVR